MKCLVLLAMAGCLAGTGSTQATPSDGGRPDRADDDAAVAGDLPIAGVVTNPDWVQKPNGDDFARYYPPLAMSLGLTGKATLTCTVSALGTLDRCKTSDVTPEAVGFGEAALTISRYFKMKPLTIDGTPVAGGQFSTTIRFQIADEAPQLIGLEAMGPPPSAARMAAASRLMAVLDVAGLMKAFEGEIFQSMLAAVARQAGRSAATDEAFTYAFQVASREEIAQIVAIRTDIYARQFTEQELNQMTDFYNTPVGKTFLAHQAEIQAAERKATQGRYPRMQARLHEVYCSRIACGPVAPTAEAGKPASIKPGALPAH